MLQMIPGSNQSEVEYHRYHEKRMEKAFDIAYSYTGIEGKVLEVAPWTIAYNLKIRYVNCNTLGRYNKIWDVPNGGKHYPYDLFQIQPRPVTNNYDMVVACEIIEHLPFDMNTILKFLRAHVKPGGYLLIQTPNAVALKKRISLLFGSNPFPKLTPSQGESHVREYTLKELLQCGEQVGLESVEHGIYNYFDYPTKKGKAYKTLCRFLPGSFKDGITILFKRV